MSSTSRPWQRGRSAESLPPGGSLREPLRALPRRTGRQLDALRGYARLVDDLSRTPRPDVARADRLAALDRVEAQVRDLFAGRPIAIASVAALAPVVAARRLPVAPLLRMIEAGRKDLLAPGYDTFDQLVEYCSLAANPAGELALRVFGEPAPEQVALSDRICTGLRLIEQLRDIERDRRAGRTYLPAEDLDRFGVAEADLDAPTAKPSLRALVEFESERAGAWLEAGTPLVSTLRGWARLSVTTDLAAGRAALGALARAGYDPLPAALGTGGWQVLAQWLGGSVRRAG
jgi:phytoene/squalene synthetase